MSDVMHFPIHELLVVHMCACLHMHAHAHTCTCSWMCGYLCHHCLLKMVFHNTAKSKKCMKFIKTFGLVAVPIALLELADSF